ncbi:YfiR family protein [Serratia sp. T13T92]|uniref:YfiR family protein n=1 Tax=Serratia sp. T13T92 TaxID=3397496 RepID=UPI0039E05099
MKMSIQARKLAARTQGLCSNPVRSRHMLPILLLAMLTFPSLAGADTQDPYQKRIHTVTTVVVGIISYARWPAKPDPIRLCVTAPVQYAEGLFDPVLLTAPQPIKTLRIEIDNPQLATSCDVVYLGDVNAAQKQDFFHRISGHSILSISEKDMECAVGSAFCLQISNDQAGFKVNLDSLARSGVRVHPNVLQLARKKGPPQ